MKKSNPFAKGKSKDMDAAKGGNKFKGNKAPNPFAKPAAPGGKKSMPAFMRKGAK
jgi:hypothetical protein